MRATSARTPKRHPELRAFDEVGHAQAALLALKDAGFRPEQIQVVTRDPEMAKALVAGSGMGTGGTLAGLVGVLTARGMSKEDAREYAERVERGRALLVLLAATDQQSQRAVEVFEGLAFAPEPWSDYEYAIRKRAVAFVQLAYAHLARRAEFETRPAYRAQARYYYPSLLAAFCKKHGDIIDAYDRYWPPGASSAGIFAIITKNDELWLRYYRRPIAAPDLVAEIGAFLSRCSTEARVANTFLPPGASRHDYIIRLFDLTNSALVALDALLAAGSAGSLPAAPSSASGRATTNAGPARPNAARAAASSRFRFFPLPRGGTRPPPFDPLTHFANLKGDLAQLQLECRGDAGMAQREARRKYFRGMLTTIIILIVLAGVAASPLVVAVVAPLIPATLEGALAALRALEGPSRAVLAYVLPGVAGGLGALLSVLNRVANGQFLLDTRLGWRANEQLGRYRPLIGVIAAIALVILLKGTLVTMSVAPGPSAFFTYLGLAFVAGFSERFANVMLTRAEIRAETGGKAPEHGCRAVAPLATARHEGAAVVPSPGSRSWECAIATSFLHCSRSPAF